LKYCSTYVSCLNRNCFSLQVRLRSGGGEGAGNGTAIVVHLGGGAYSVVRGGDLTCCANVSCTNLHLQAEESVQLSVYKQCSNDYLSLGLFGVRISTHYLSANQESVEATLIKKLFSYNSTSHIGNEKEKHLGAMRSLSSGLIKMNSDVEALNKATLSVSSTTAKDSVYLGTSVGVIGFVVLLFLLLFISRVFAARRGAV
jgi:hypothetical protein